jgi:deazaflavin-dependent oxidoreductase (nitroreductase family)
MNRIICPAPVMVRPSWTLLVARRDFRQEAPMPMHRRIARFNRAVLNPITRRFAGRFAPFVLVSHTGRKSGTVRKTPVWGFPTPDGFIIALTYGPQADWVRNVLAAGQCAVVYRNRAISLTNPSLLDADPRTQPLPKVIKVALRVMGVRDFLVFPTRIANW